MEDLDRNKCSSLSCTHRGGTRNVTFQVFSAPPSCYPCLKTRPKPVILRDLSWFPSGASDWHQNRTSNNATAFFLVIKPIRYTNFTIYFGMKIYMFRTVPVSNIRSLFTVHSAMVYVIQALYTQLSSRTRMELLESCLQSCMTYTIAECTVNKLLMMDRGTVRNM